MWIATVWTNYKKMCRFFIEIPQRKIVSAVANPQPTVPCLVFLNTSYLHTTKIANMFLFVNWTFLHSSQLTLAAIQLPLAFSRIDYCVLLRWQIVITVKAHRLFLDGGAPNCMQTLQIMVPTCWLYDVQMIRHGFHYLVHRGPSETRENLRIPWDLNSWPSAVQR